MFYFRNSKFFEAYSISPKVHEGTTKKAYLNIQKTREAMEDTAKGYFKNLYLGYQEEPQLDFEEKNEGAYAGIIVNVRHSTGLKKYYMKTNLGAGMKESSLWEKPELRELYTYKLLEVIQVVIIHLPLLPIMF